MNTAMRTLWLPAVLVATAFALVVAGCGGGDDSGTAASAGGETVSADSGGGAETKPLSYFEDNVKTLLGQGTFTKPYPKAPKPMPDKEVAVVTFGLGISPSVRQARGVEEAADALGWSVRVLDGKFDPNQQLAALNQAIAFKPDAIIMYFIDCKYVEAGLQRAKEAGIPVVSNEGYDCSATDPDGESYWHEGGLYHTQPFGGDVPQNPGWQEGWGKAAADAMIVAKEGEAKAIEFYESDAMSLTDTNVGFREEMALCEKCEILDTVEFTAADFGRLREITSQALLQNPDANAIYGLYDAPVTSGIAAAVQASGRADEIYVTGGEGNAANAELVREGAGQNVGIGLENEWEGWAAVDAVNRVLNGETTNVPNGFGLALWDKEHGLPAEGEVWRSPVDYRQAYLEAWGVE